jgi:hypothetical protein
MACAEQSRSLFLAACELIREELVAGRGVSVPDLGTFSVDRSRNRPQPLLVLSASFERLGVKLPPVRSSAGATHMIGWLKIAQRCDVDRDLARRAVAQTIDTFARQVAEVTNSGGQHPRATASLSLGSCGTLRILRCNDRGTCEPRVVFAPSLLQAIINGPVLAATGDAVKEGGAIADATKLVQKTLKEDSEEEAATGSTYITLDSVSRMQPVDAPQPAMASATAVEAAVTAAPTDPPGLALPQSE